jgi:CHAD domain-containing protein
MSPKAQPSASHRGSDALDFHLALETPHIAEWIEQASRELDEVREHFKPRHVHDLRVALRRCRSVAMGLEQLDPCEAWPSLKKSAKHLLEGLGDLRDIQVMREGIKQLDLEKSEAGIRLSSALDERDDAASSRARKVLNHADRKQWHKWAAQLPKRAERVPIGGPAAELLVLEQWREAWELHRHAARFRSAVSYHKLRVGIKRFRDSVDNFLPARLARWGKELKKLQDILGELHDIDVLWATVVRLRPLLAKSERSKCQKIIHTQRGLRLAAYREKTQGPKSLWKKWRGALPSGQALRQAQLDWLAVWASYLDPEPAHSRHVARLAIQIFDGLLQTAIPVILPLRARDLLEAAAILHDVGRAEGEHKHQKTSYKLIHERTPPPGWSRAEMETVALVARYHRGGLSKLQEKSQPGIPGAHQEGILLLAGILRVAVALANRSVSGSEISVSEVKVEYIAGAIAIRAAGYNGEEPLASKLAAARHLLESVLHHPIVIESAGTPRYTEIPVVG